MAKFQDIDFRFVNAAGRDVTGTDAVTGYQVRDFFSCDLVDVGDLDDDGMRLAYLGPDCDGIGVEWTFAPVAACA